MDGLDLQRLLTALIMSLPLGLGFALGGLILLWRATSAAFSRAALGAERRRAGGDRVSGQGVFGVLGAGARRKV